MGAQTASRSGPTAGIAYVVMPTASKSRHLNSFLYLSFTVIKVLFVLVFR